MEELNMRLVTFIIYFEKEAESVNSKLCKGA